MSGKVFGPFQYKTGSASYDPKMTFLEFNQEQLTKNAALVY
jgi:hypothetical protein